MFSVLHLKAETLFLPCMELSGLTDFPRNPARLWKALTLSSGWAPSIRQGCITPSPPSGTGANLVPRPSGCLRLQQHMSSKRGDTGQERGKSQPQLPR